MKKFLAAMSLAVLCLGQSGNRSGIDRSNLDATCKPCEDFWRYANGGWVDKNPIPAALPSWGTFYVLREANRERLSNLLQSASASQSGTDARRVGDLYAACMDTASIDAAGAKPLDPMLQRIAGVKTRQDLAALLVAFEGEGGIAPTTIIEDTDLDNANQMITGIAAGGLSLPDRDYYFRDDDRSKAIREEFLGQVQRMLQLLGDSPATAAASAKAILEFESTLAKATLTNIERRDPYKQFHKMDFARLQQLAPEYDWKAAFRLLKISETVPVNIEEPEFVKALNTAIQTVPVETWKTWLRWRLVNDRSQYLAKPFYDEWFRFNQTVLLGVKEQRPRWQICSTVTDAMLGDALGKLYVDKYFPPEAKRRMGELVENLRSSLREMLQDANWLEPETRKNAIRKLNAFDPQIGYPTRWRDYSQVKVSRGDYLGSMESAALENRRFALSKIGKKIDRSLWHTTAPTVNAYYSPDRNSIVFPAGILQPPFFEMGADDAVNYGAIGAVIGHEMGHGFDDEGAKFDAAGNLKNWWTPEDVKKFEAKSGCVTEQFDTIDVGEGLHHKGKLVTGEAMGDLGGITLAYKAYHKALKGKDAPVIDGFTGDQRFFLAFARLWANNIRPEQARLLLNTDPHPLAKFRTNATLANMPEFHKAFNCKLGDPMVRPPEKQCRLW